MDRGFALSPLDHIFSNLLGIYFYDGRLEKDNLQESLIATTKSIPVLSSEIQPGFDGEYLVVPNEPCKVEIIEKVVEEDLHNLYLPNEEGILSYNEGLRFVSLCESIDLSSQWGEPKFGVPNLKITLLQSTLHKKSVLCVSINHCISDAHSLAHFMNAWSQGEKRLIKNFTLSREGMKATKGYDVSKCDLRSAQFLQEIYRKDLNTVPEDEIGFTLGTRDKYVERLITFSEKSIQQLKEEVRKCKPNPNFRFSSNDCICAFMLKFHAIRTEGPKSGNIPFKLVINTRRRYSRIDDSYFGNAMTVPNIDFKRQEILDMPFGDLVSRVRGLINEVNDEMCETLVEFVNYAVKNRKDFSRKFTFWMNDWRIMDVLKPHFGDVKCDRVLLNPPKKLECFPQFGTVMMNNKNELVVRMYLKNEDHERLKKMDLSSLSTLEELKKMKF